MSILHTSYLLRTEVTHVDGGAQTDINSFDLECASYHHPASLQSLLHKPITAKLRWLAVVGNMIGKV